MNMMEIVDMEHMAMPWLANYNDESQQWDIVTDSAGETWYVACVPLALPGDYDGEKTAKAICELHNRSLTSNPTLHRGGTLHNETGGNADE
jgi:hypothetical protein